ncbi:MAG: hypothetical protein U9N56_06860 [Actinomycetota bacterium]|nr:hypothetical protein [Actinomycetota bacterium]
MKPEAKDEDVLLISRILDKWAEENLGGEPDWGPLEAVLPMQWCDGFMWMNRLEHDGVTIELYKHGITRRYLNLDQNGNAYRFTNPGYEWIPMAFAVELVFGGLEEMGHTRETKYDEEFVRMKHQAYRDAGYTVISTAQLGQNGGSTTE